MIVQHSPWKYLRLVALSQIVIWQLALAGLHHLDVQFARQNPSLEVSLEQACHDVKTDVKTFELCEKRTPAKWAEYISLSALLILAKLMVLIGSLPYWPENWRAAVLRYAHVWGIVGLLTTLLLVIARGVTVALITFALPLILWGQRWGAIAAILAMVAIIRLPRHAIRAWILATSSGRRLVGREISSQEEPEIWEIVKSVSHKIGVKPPERLIMGLQPDVVLVTGRFYLDPVGIIYKGRTLYLGFALIQALNRHDLHRLIGSALARVRGARGNWLPEIEDWIFSADCVLKENLQCRARGEIKSEVDPALEAWGYFVALIKLMLVPFQIEAKYQRRDGAEDLVDDDAKVDELRRSARLAWQQKTFPPFMTALSAGIKYPRTQESFEVAFWELLDITLRKEPKYQLSSDLYQSLVEQETEWMLVTAQVSLPNDCWELRTENIKR